MKFEKLGNIVKISKGKKHTPAPKRVHHNFRYIQIEDLRNNDNLKYTDEKGVEVHENDLIIAWDGANAGTIGFGLRGMIGSTLARLRINEDKEYNTDFIGYFLKGKFDYLRANATGATIPHIDRNSLESLKIPSIDFPEQYEIAKVLSKSEDLIKQRKESIELLDKFLEGTFYDMFGDPTVGANLEKIGAHLVLTGGAAFKSSDFIDEGVPVIKIGTVNKGFFDTKTLSFLPETFLTSFERYIIRPGDLLLSLTGTVGKDDYGNACFATSDYGSYLLNQRVAKITVDEAFLNLHFVYYLFKFPKFKHSLIKADRGVRQANLSNNDIYDLKISYPPIHLQKAFASIVEKAEALKKHFTESLNELENLFGSLNQRAFKGELKFRNHFIDTNDPDALSFLPEGNPIDITVADKFDASGYTENDVDKINISDFTDREIGDPLEGMDLPEGELPKLDDILKHSGDKAELITGVDKKEVKEKSSSPFEDIFIVAGSISNYKPILNDVQPFIQKTFRDSYFTFESLKQATVKAGWQYDFETLKNFVFALLRQGKLKQVFADAAFKSSFKESDADFHKIKELNEQMYLQQVTTL